MRPTDIQIIGKEMAIKWDDNTESYLGLERLRRSCPCAGCRGELDVLGNLAKGPEIPLSEKSFEVLHLVRVGGYAVQPVWADGHSTGIYSFEYLHKLAAGN